VRQLTKLLLILLLPSIVYAGLNSDEEERALEGINYFKNMEYDKAVPLLRCASKKQHPEAEYCLGEMYYAALGGLEESHISTLRWRLASAKHGFPKAQGKLANMYLHGCGTSQNRIEAFAWKEIAKLHNVESIMDGEVKLEESEKVAISIRVNVLWRELYADNLEVANKKSVADGIKAFNDSQYGVAAELLKAPASLGDKGAQYYLGTMFLNGTGPIPRNIVTAFKMISDSAWKGFFKAQVELGEMYYKKNSAVGCAWLNVAVRNGGGSVEGCAWLNVAVINGGDEELQRLTEAKIDRLTAVEQREVEELTNKILCEIEKRSRVNDDSTQNLLAQEISEEDTTYNNGGEGQKYVEASDFRAVSDENADTDISEGGNIEGSLIGDDSIANSCVVEEANLTLRSPYSVKSMGAVNDIDDYDAHFGEKRDNDALGSADNLESMGALNDLDRYDAHFGEKRDNYALESANNLGVLNNMEDYLAQFGEEEENDGSVFADNSESTNGSLTGVEVAETKSESGDDSGNGDESIDDSCSELGEDSKYETAMSEGSLEIIGSNKGVDDFDSIKKHLPEEVTVAKNKSGNGVIDGSRAELDEDQKYETVISEDSLAFIDPNSRDKCENCHGNSYVDLGCVVPEDRETEFGDNDVTSMLDECSIEEEILKNPKKCK